jgi:hypothetical protein
VFRPALAAIAALFLLAGCSVEVDDGSIDGGGYRFDIADGWEDVTEDAPSLSDVGAEGPAFESVDIDSFVATEGEDNFAPNLGVVTSPVGGLTDPVRLAEQNLRFLESQGAEIAGAEGRISVSDVEPTELGGDPAAAYETTGPGPSGEIRQRQIFAIRDGTGYAITYSGLADGQFEENLPAAEQMLDSWTWD